MTWLSELVRRVRMLLRREQFDRELAEEMRLHRESKERELAEAGLLPEEARSAAHRQFGNTTLLQEESRMAWGWNWLEQLLQDVRFGVRVLRKNPGFTAVTVLTLALGIGANTIIFSVINGLFLHPTGIADPNHLFAIRVKYDKLNLKSIVISAPDFKNVQDSKEIFSSAAASNEESFNYLAPDGPQRLIVAKVSWQWFETFGVHPAFGRLFRPEEDQPHANHVALLAFDTWKSLFAGDPLIVGKSIQLNHEDYRVVGVMGPDFDWPRRAQLWVPLGLAASAFAPDKIFNESLFVVARARPGIPPAQAEAFVRVLAGRLIQAHSENTYAKDSGWGMFAIPFTEYTSGDLRTPMLILLGAVGFVLLIACSNIGGLFLARASTRAKEFAVRVALGAQKRDLLRQSLTESLLLTACGAIAGVAGAYGGIGLLIRRAPGNLSSRLVIHVDGHVLLFAVLLMILTGVFLGLVPITEVFSHRQYGMLREEARTVASSRGRLHLREFLVVGQVAMALVLLVGAGLLLKSLTRMGRVDTGFDPTGVMTASVQLPENQYSNQEKQAAFYRAVNEKLAALPGVSSAAFTVALPFTGFTPASSFSIEGRPLGPGDPGPRGGLNWITPGYFEAMRIPLQQGRKFTDQDRLGTQPVAIIDENLARQYWPDQNPVGQHLRRGSNSPWATIVGVVGHVKQSALVDDSGKGVSYYPILQQPIPQAFLIVRTTADPARLAGSLQAAVASIDPAQPVANLKTMEQYVAGSLSPQRIAVALLGIFSVLALFLASIGIYGVISFNTARRTQEIGIRMALGAQRRQVWGIVIRRGLRLALAGVLAGVVAASFVAQFLRSQLFEVSAFDPATFALTCLTLLVVTLAACYIPAWRATRVDPMVALHYE
jgi:putative ABC transport system permease protein